MATFVVIKTGGNVLPPDNGWGSADMFMATAADVPSAAAQAAQAWNCGPNTEMYVAAVGAFTPYHSTGGVAAG